MSVPAVLLQPPWKQRAKKSKRDPLNVEVAAGKANQRALRLLETLDAVLGGREHFPDEAPKVTHRDYASPPLAVPMARFLRRPGKMQKMAASWLDAHPQAAMLGLVPALVGPDGSVREQCLAALRRLRAAGHRLDEAALAYGLEAELAPWLGPFDPVAEADSVKLPSFLRPGELRRPRLADGGDVPEAAADHLAELLSLCGADSSPALAEVRAALDCAAFAADLLEAWVTAKCPPEHRWLMQATAHLGGPEAVRRLVSLVHAWPGEAAHARAQDGLAVLLRMGSVEALAGVHDIAVSSRYPALREAARQGFTEEARRRGLSWDELADEAVPAELDPELEKMQCARFEQAMIGGRQWTRARFQDRILGHRGLRRLAALLVWQSGARRFRLAEDGTFADREDRPLGLGDQPIALPHPVLLEAGELAAWQDLWRDYELVQPFPQLHRPLYHATEPERASGRVRRFEGRQVAGNRLFGLQQRGWTAHNVDEHLDTFRRGEATLSFSPGLELDVRPLQPQVLGELSVPTSLSPVEFSEVLLDVDSL